MNKTEAKTVAFDLYTYDYEGVDLYILYSSRNKNRQLSEGKLVVDVNPYCNWCVGKAELVVERLDGQSKEGHLHSVILYYDEQAHFYGFLAQRRMAVNVRKFDRWCYSQRSSSRPEALKTQGQSTEHLWGRFSSVQ